MITPMAWPVSPSGFICKAGCRIIKLGNQAHILAHFIFFLSYIIFMNIVFMHYSLRATITPKCLFVESTGLSINQLTII